MKRLLVLCALFVPLAWAQTITLPIEVIGLDGVTNAQTITIPGGSDITGTMKLSMQIHALKYETQASVQINSSAFIPINTANSTISGLGASYGGIGGGFTTLQLTINIPTSTIVIGSNTITWRFNATNGINSGYRVLAFNVLDHNGAALIPGGNFVQEDPSTWTPPLNNPSDISKGKTLFQTQALNTVTGTGTGGTPLTVHCMDCHAQDGRDLKYFNYSNNAIEIRSQVHGLSVLQGQQIASYIRSLTTPSPGRPWNPPYQPGPGLDAGPVTSWSAGAGLGAVLSTDYAIYGDLAPGGDTSGWAPTGNINARQIRTDLQLPDWASWLPINHPKDTFGSTFTSNAVYTNYLAIRAALIPNNCTSYSSVKGNFFQWQHLDDVFLAPFVKAANDPAWLNATYTLGIYSMRLWSMMKNWEVNQEFGLEAMPACAFGPGTPDFREWASYEPFFASPNMIHIPTTAVGIGVHNTLPVTATFVRHEWYELQLILNQHSSDGLFSGNTPNDFGYVFNHIQTLGLNAIPAGSAPQTSTMFKWLIKGLQASNLNGKGPEFGSAGWQPIATDLSRTVIDSVINQSYNSWSNTDRVNALTGYLTAWSSKATSFTAAQYYAGGWATSADIPDANYPYNSFANAVAFTVPIALFYGVNSSWATPVTTWAQTIWPLFTWSTLLSATCHNGTLNVVCIPGSGAGAGPPVIITTSPLPSGTQNVPYSTTVTGNGLVPQTWIMVGTTPPGLSITPLGTNTPTGISSVATISGTPTLPGTYTFTVTATNTAGNGSQVFTLVIAAAPPTPPSIITATPLAAATVSTPYTTTLSATGTAPITWAITLGVLPLGLSLNASIGVISGTPTTLGTSTFTATATNGAGSNSKIFSLSVGGTPPTITTASPLPAGTINVAYTTTISATGTTPITWDLMGTTLPTGLSLNTTTGVISGTPTVAGTFTFTVRATSAAGTSNKPFSLTINGIAPSITSKPPLPSGTLSVSYTTTLTATGSAPITWALVTGSLPTGLSLNTSTGVISGTPSATGTSAFRVSATNGSGSDQKNLNITINGVPPTITTATPLPRATQGTAYSTTIAATGTTPITWSITSGTLPASLSLNASTGVISGTPSGTGTSSFTVLATNGAGTFAKAFSLTVIPTPVAPTITSTSPLPQGNQNVFYSVALLATGTTPITWSVTVGSLPTGLSLDPNLGLISGTPTTVATSNFTIQASNVAGTNSVAFTLSIVAGSGTTIAGNSVLGGSAVIH